MIWKTRLQLEAMSHPHTSAATLTYADPAMPLTPSGLPTLTPPDLRNWLKKFRKAIQPSHVRFYAAGEYSPRERPHYHVILFGFPGCAYGKSRYQDGHTINCCWQCDLVRDTWGKGIIQLEPANDKMLGYVAGYVMKKMTSKHDTRLNGRNPEFARMSNRPGIGHSSVKALSKISADRLANGQAVDVADHVRINGKKQLLGRYIRNKIRKELGREEKASPEIQEQITAKLLLLLHDSKTDPEAITLKKQLIKEAQAAIDRIKFQHENFDTRKRNRSL